MAGAVFTAPCLAAVYSAQKHVAEDIDKTKLAMAKKTVHDTATLSGMFWHYFDTAKGAVSSVSNFGYSYLTRGIEYLLDIIPGGWILRWCSEQGKEGAKKALELTGRSHDQIVKSDAFKNRDAEGNVAVVAPRSVHPDPTLEPSSTPLPPENFNAPPPSSRTQPPPKGINFPPPRPVTNAVAMKRSVDAEKKSWWSTALWTLGIGSAATAATSGYAKYQHDTWDPRAAFGPTSTGRSETSDQNGSGKPTDDGDYFSMAKNWSTQTWSALPAWAQVAIPVVFTLGLGYFLWPSKKKHEQTSTRPIESGTSTSRRSGSTGSASDKKPVSMPLGIVILIGIAVVLLIAGIVWAFSKGGSDDCAEDQYDGCDRMV